jgi:single-stranded-DNA-specific exonuclease
MRWALRNADDAAVRLLANELKLSPIVARLLAARGVVSLDEAQRFLSPQLAHLHSPYLMLGMKAAVERLQAAIAKKEDILIYGDYDVDGTTAVVILKTVIELCGGVTQFHVPHRIKEGYGMKDDVIERSTTLAPPVPSGPRPQAAPAAVDETPSAEEAAAIAATTVFEPDVPEPEIVAEPLEEQETASDGSAPASVGSTGEEG